MKPNRKRKTKSRRDGTAANYLLKLRYALDSVLDVDPEPAIRRGLLPGVMVANIQAAHFLADTVIPARNAQRSTGVPASLLLTEALRDSGWSACNLAAHEGGIGRYFVDLAKHLAGNPAVHRAAKAAAERNPAAFTEGILKCEQWSPQRRADVLETIIYYHLDQCDWMTPTERGHGWYRATLSYKERLALAEDYRSAALSRLALKIRKTTGFPAGLAKETAKCMVAQLEREMDGRPSAQPSAKLRGTV